MEELIKYMKALTFMQLQQLTGNTAFEKPELLLSKAGFTAKEIAELLGKKEGAVAKALHRAKTAVSK